MPEENKNRKRGYPFRTAPSIPKNDDEDEEKKDAIERKSPPRYNVYKK